MEWFFIVNNSNDSTSNVNRCRIKNATRYNESTWYTVAELQNNNRHSKKKHIYIFNLNLTIIIVLRLMLIMEDIN